MNFKSFIVPVVTLIYGVICGFLVCYGKITNDWAAALTIITGFTSAFATLVGAGVVLWVFLQWRSQKASEVLALEAKSLIGDIFELDEIISNLVNIIRNKDDLDDLESRYKVLMGTMKTKVNFISLGINEQDKMKSITVLPDLMEGFYKSFSHALHHDEECIRVGIISMTLCREERDKNSAYTKLKMSFNGALSTCRDLSLYKK